MIRGLGDVLEGPLFASLPRGARHELAAAARLQVYKEGQVVYRAGELADTLVVVLSGELSLRRDDGAGAVLLLHVAEGETAGTEAIIGLSRRATARAVLPATVGFLSSVLLRRAVAKHGGERALASLERALLRESIASLLGRVALGEELSAKDRDDLAASVVPRRVRRGERVGTAGEVPTSAVLVLEGMIEVRAPAAEGGRTAAFLAPGDVIDDDAVLAGRGRSHDLFASGDSLVGELPAREVRRFALAWPGALERARRVAVAFAEKADAELPLATRHAFQDLYRLHVARSLLVIDLETCVGCGHCAYSCASLHGVARIVRRGDALTSRDGEARARTLLLPSSCQHCELPSCMPACPTGAIGRDPSGEVTIREALCTGCEACAKACPWDNIQMGPRASNGPIFLDGSGAARIAGSSAAVAVKCDLCKGFEVAACVDGCPVDAIVRLSPDEARPGEVTGSPGEPALLVPAPRAAWPAVLSSALVASGLVLWAESARRGSHLGPARGLGLAFGVAAAVLLVWLAGYGARKRLVALFVRRGKRVAGARSSVRPHTIAHLALGVLAPALAFAHGGWVSPRSGGGALSWALAVATALGIVAAAAYALLPSQIARLTPEPRLLEDVPRERKLLEDRLFRELSGRSDLVKKIAERVLLPYQREGLGPLWLLLSGRTRREERDALAARIDARLQGRGKDQRDGLSALLRTVVEHRALRASAALGRLASWVVPLHVFPSMIVLALLVAHVLAAVAR